MIAYSNETINTEMKKNPLRLYVCQKTFLTFFFSEPSMKKTNIEAIY